jgi:hypothetical protein
MRRPPDPVTAFGVLTALTALPLTLMLATVALQLTLLSLVSGGPE